MRPLKLNLIAAACENMGIGIKGDLPWHLKNELKYFSRQTKKVANPSKKNVVIMGRKTYFGIPESKRPLPERINIVLTTAPQNYEFPSGVVVCKSMSEALTKIQEPEMEELIENVWIVGGCSVYKEAMESDLCHRIYFTRIMGTFDCDTFFPDLTDDFVLVPNDADIPEDVQEENGTKYQYQIYEKVKIVD